MGRKLLQLLTTSLVAEAAKPCSRKPNLPNSGCRREVVLRSTGPLSLWAAYPFSSANQRGRKALWRRDVDLVLSQGPQLCSGYEVTTATKSVQGSSLVDRLRHASCVESASPTTGEKEPSGGRAPPGPRPRPARSGSLPGALR